MCSLSFNFFFTTRTRYWPLTKIRVYFRARWSLLFFYMYTTYKPRVANNRNVCSLHNSLFRTSCWISVTCCHNVSLYSIKIRPNPLCNPPPPPPPPKDTPRFWFRGSCHLIKILVWISWNFQWQMEQRFPELIPEKWHLRLENSDFRKFLTGNSVPFDVPPEIFTFCRFQEHFTG